MLHTNVESMLLCFFVLQSQFTVLLIYNILKIVEDNEI